MPDKINQIIENRFFKYHVVVATVIFAMVLREGW